VITALRLTAGVVGSIVDVQEPAAEPVALAIQEIRPNPTSGSATLTLALPRRTSARLAAYDVNGRLVRTLWNGEMDAGVRTVTWDGCTDHGARAPGGVYFLRFESRNQRAVRRLAILR
jgi:flagellar hook assembly protein FlgD